MIILSLALLTFLASFTSLSFPLFLPLPFFILLLLLLLLQHFTRLSKSFTHGPYQPTNSFLSFLTTRWSKAIHSFVLPTQAIPKSLLFHYLITIRANRQPPRHVLSSINGCVCHPPHHTRKLNIMSRSQSRSCSRPSAFVQALDHPHGLRPLHDPIPTPKQRLYH